MLNKIPDVLKNVIKDIKTRRMIYYVAGGLAIIQGIPQVRDMLSVLYDADVFGYAATMVIPILGGYAYLVIIGKKV